MNFMVDAAMRVMASSISGIKARSCDVVVVSCVESSMGGASIIQAGIARASKALVGGGAALVLSLNRCTQQLQGQGSVQNARSCLSESQDSRCVA